MMSYFPTDFNPQNTVKKAMNSAHEEGLRVAEALSRACHERREITTLRAVDDRALYILLDKIHEELRRRKGGEE